MHKQSPILFKVSFRHPEISGKFLVFATELDVKHQIRVAKLARRNGLELEDALKIAAVMNIALSEPELTPVDVRRISYDELAQLITNLDRN